LFNIALIEGLKGSDPPKLMPGAEIVIENLARRSIALAIATGAERACVVAMGDVYPKFFGRFKAVVTSSDIAVGKGKPDPESFLKAAASLGVPPENTLVVDDRAECLVRAQREGFATAHFVGECVEVLNDFNIVLREWAEFERALAALTRPSAEKV
jgi:HAD superfamily hydrolase (TIGR01509 family)